MTNETQDNAASPHVQLVCVEVNRFRRLRSVITPIDPKTTVFVGANNSGKTSVLNAIRKFLSSSSKFGAFDLSIDQWPKLRQLAETWEELDELPSSNESGELNWEDHLRDFLACMPTLDLWFNIQEGAYHLALPFLPSLKWSGGIIGLRIRLEPASNIEELQTLASRYREARLPFRDQSGISRAWPTDILDYWLRHPKDLSKTAIYKLDPAKSPLENQANYTPQELPDTAVSVERSSLTPLIQVDFVPAQRGLGMEEGDNSPGSNPHRVGLFSQQVLRYARKNLSSDNPNPGHHPELLNAIAKAQEQLDSQIRAVLEPTIGDVRKLGYPGLHDPQDIEFRTRINTAELLDHSTAVQYRVEGQTSETLFPEHTIGLGYQNLQSLSYQLVSFRDERLNPPAGTPAAVHLVLLEEPEAHLHVQVQRVFPRRAHELIKPSDEAYPHLSTQLILSTHASHLAHSESFTNLRYVKRTLPSQSGDMAASEIVNLADVFGTDIATRTFAERYFQVQHTDLLFADAAVLVEGTAERMLVPLYVENNFPNLRSRYISYLDVGGSHAHRLKPLIERLGIPTVVITDIDPVELVQGKNGKSVRKAAFISDPKKLECGNSTLRDWHPGKTSLTDYREPSGDELVWRNNKGTRIRFAWQTPVGETDTWPTSWEDSLILTNLEWFRKQTEETGPFGRAVEVTQENTDQQKLLKALHEMMHKSFKKGDFAATIFEKVSLGEPIKCPTYISSALSWLENELQAKKGGPEA